MAECVFCKAETQLHENGLPICLRCSDARDSGTFRRSAPSELQIREILRQEVLETTTVLNAASEAFNALVGAIPSGAPHPDGALRLQQASHKLSVARKDMIRAHSRLNDYLSRGVVPEELKRASGEAD